MESVDSPSLMDYDDNLTPIAERYANLMQSYLANPCPVALHTASELGHLAVNLGIDFREIGKVYQQTLVKHLETCDTPQSYIHVTCQAKDFLTYSLSPFQKQNSIFAKETSVAVSQTDTMSQEEETKTDLFQSQQLKQINQQLLNEIAHRQKTEIELRHSEEKFRQLAENIQSIFWIRSVEGNQFGELVYVSPGYHSIWDHSHHQVYASSESFLNTIYPEDRKAIAKFVTIPPSEPYDVVYRILRLDGEVRWLHSRAFPIFDVQGQIYRVVGICEDVTQQKHTEQELHASIAKKELLIKEIQHRVKNNLQIVCSLLQLQAKTIPKRYKEYTLSQGNLQSAIAQDNSQSLIAQLLKETEQRIFTMALLYEQLYSSDNLSQISLPKYLQDLVSCLCQSYEITPNSIQFQLQINPIELNIETAIPCGLIVNELVTNILLHAFPNDQKGKVILRCSQTQDKKFCLTIKDDGIGLPADIGLLKEQSLGFKIVTMLADQIDGEVSVVCNSGTKICINFSELNYENRI